MAEGKRKATLPLKGSGSSFNPPTKKRQQNGTAVELGSDTDEEVSFPTMQKEPTTSIIPPTAAGVRPEDMAMINYLTNHISLANGTLKSELSSDFKVTLEP